MKRILLIDDDPDVVYLIHEALSMKKFLVNFAFDGEEGLRKCFSDYFDLVIIDMEMPKLKGLEVSKQIRNSKNHHSILIGISGTPRKLSRKHFDAVFHKPFRLKTFLNKVQYLLQETGEQNDIAINA